MSRNKAPVFVVHHTAGEFLGLIEDHLEGRGVRFLYFRPFTAGGGLGTPRFPPSSNAA